MADSGLGEEILTSRKPTLVTGATGFLGKHLVERLAAGPEAKLRLLNRSPSAFDTDARVEVIRGDVTVDADVERAVAGCGLVYHLAGFVSRDPADAPKLHRIHVDGTRSLLEKALKHGVERVVVASSSGTIAVSRTGKVHNEESGYKETEVARWAYYVSKIAEEKLALDLHASSKLPVVIANPSLLLGPGDDRNSSTGDIIDFLEGQVLSLPGGGLNFVDARDCAAGLVAAMERGRPGERYLFGGVNWTCAEFTRHLAKLAGRGVPLFSSPTWLSLLSAPILRKAMPLIGRKFTIDDETIEMSGMFWYCDSSKAQRELGFTTRDPLETLRDTLEDIYRRRPELQRNRAG